MSGDLPRIINTTDLPLSEAKWITLKKATYLDQDGKQRVWEYAERKTRAKASGVDGVAVLAVIRSKTNAFPVSTILIEQYRPPIGKFLIELPAGLVDEGETVEAAAIRELREETGYIADEVLQMSPVIVADPGMTNANMQLAVISVTMEDKLLTPVPQLDAGEHIVTRVVELAHLQDALNDYDKQGFVVNALVTHFAFGYTVAQKFK